MLFVYSLFLEMSVGVDKTSSSYFYKLFPYSTYSKQKALHIPALGFMGRFLKRIQMG